MIVQKNINIWPQCYSTTEEPDRQCVRHGSSHHRSGPRFYGSPLRFTEGIGANPTHVSPRVERGQVQAGDCPARFNLTGYRRRPTRDQGPRLPEPLCATAVARDPGSGQDPHPLPSQARGRHRDTAEPWVRMGRGGRAPARLYHALGSATAHRPRPRPRRGPWPKDAARFSWPDLPT